MPNYLGVLEEMQRELMVARQILIQGTLSAYLEYYQRELHESSYLKTLTTEVNEACEIAFSDVLHEAKCHVTFNQVKFDHDGIIAFDVNSEIFGSLGFIEMTSGEGESMKLYVRKEELSLVFNKKGVSDLKEYTKYLEKIEELLDEQDIKVIFS